MLAASRRDTQEEPRPSARSGYWLFSARVDLAVFLGSALVALALLPVGAELGVLYGDSPEWTWVTAILLIDVAHVWSTTFRVYLDREEFARRRWLYISVPLFAWFLGATLYSEGPHLFWRVLAYMAVFHFVRQQFGWVALYRARVGETGRLGRLYDTAVIYAATVYPLLFWHAHLPREFWWFLPGDFASLGSVGMDLVAVLEPVYWALVASYVLRMGYLWWAHLARREPGIAAAGARPAWRFNPGKDIVVLSTIACWYIGIVALNSDYAFTVTNVIIHGVPYFALVYWYGKRRATSGRGGPVLGALLSGRGALVRFLVVLWLVAYVEELLWHRAVWHEHAWLFGDALELESWHTFLVPLLAVPQATHYILDGFIWRRRHNPDFQKAGEFAG